MSDIVRKKDTGEPGNGGQFGTTTRAGSGLVLDQATADVGGHDHACRAHAIGCAVENLREAGTDGDPVAVGDDYLASGTATCYCGRDTGPVAEWVALGESALAERQQQAAGDGDLDTYLGTLSPQDRELAAALLDPDNDYTGAIGGDTPAELFDEYEGYSGGFRGLEFPSEVEAVGGMLVGHEVHSKGLKWDAAPWLDLVRDEAGDVEGFEVAVELEGLRLAQYRELGQATDDLDAEGFAAALAIARVLRKEFDLVTAQRERLRPPTVEQMRAAVRVADWKVAGQQVMFREDGDGAAQYARVRRGMWDENGRPVPEGTAEQDSHVMLTMQSGRDRFVPFATLQRWVLEGRVHPT